MKEDLIADLELANKEIEDSIRNAMAARKRINKRLTTTEADHGIQEEVDLALDNLRGLIESATNTSGLLRRAQIILMDK